MENRTPRGQQGPGCTAKAAKWGRTDTGNGDRRRHAARGAETSGGGWRVAGVGNVQVEGVPRWERRWGAGVTERCYDEKRILMGGR